jgi:hypothetical protein
MRMQGLTRSLCVLAGLTTCASLATGSIWISSISSAAFGNASWVDPVAGPQTGSYYESHDWPNWSVTQSVVWPVAWAHSEIQTQADPSIPLPTMPGSYAYLKVAGRSSAWGDAEAYVSIDATFQCADFWDARLTTTGLGSIQLHGPSGMIVWLTGDHSYFATLGPGEYRIYAGVSAIYDSGSVSFTVPGASAVLLLAAVPLGRRRRGVVV